MAAFSASSPPSDPGKNNFLTPQHSDSAAEQLAELYDDLFFSLTKPESSETSPLRNVGTSKSTGGDKLRRSVLTGEIITACT